MTATENTLEALRAALDADPSNELARLTLADLLEEAGDEAGAARQRRIATLQPGSRLANEDVYNLMAQYAQEWDVEPEDVRVVAGWDGDLCVAYFRVDRADGRDGDPTSYLICRVRGDLSYDEIAK